LPGVVYAPGVERHLAITMALDIVSLGLGLATLRIHGTEGKDLSVAGLDLGVAGMFVGLVALRQPNIAGATTGALTRNSLILGEVLGAAGISISLGQMSQGC
jgi:hypothetical protein